MGRARWAGKSRQWRAATRRALTCVVACCCCAAPASANDTAELEDAAARLQYAFHTADSRALEQAIAATERLAVSGTLAGMKEYYLAFGRWKLAQVLADSSDHTSKAEARGRAAKETQACLRHAHAAIDHEPRSAEAHALSAACTDLAQSLRSARARDSAAACARNRALRRALELEPTNPRALFVEALCIHERTAAADPAALDKLRNVVQLFGVAAPARLGRPDWGQPEALLLLGQRHLQGGDPRAARDAIERALVLAPDYRAAQELLQTASRRPQ